MKFKFYFHKIDYDECTITADDLDSAKLKAQEYLQALQTDYYQGGDWYMDNEVTQL